MADFGALVLLNGPLRKSSLSGLLVIRRQSYRYSARIWIQLWWFGEEETALFKRLEAECSCRCCFMGNLSCI